MAEIRRGFGDEGSGSQRLPWLEPVEDEDDYPAPTGGNWLKWAMILLAIGVLLAIAAVLVTRWQAGRGDVGELIRADPRPYKVRPADPGGLKVDNNDRIAQRTGVGGDIDSPLDLTAIPEQPIVGAGAPPIADAAPPRLPAGPAPKSEAAGTPATPASAPVPARPTAADAPSRPAAPNGGSVQLGAFSSTATAEQAWKKLSKRFGYLEQLDHVVLPVQSGDKTLYRLRASGGPGASICARLKVAGQACSVAN
jgi:cell division septation protein DedD